MDLFLEGLESAFTWSNLFLIIIGVLIGVFFGALPGISSSMAIVLMLPFTYYMEVLPSIILLVAIYTGSAYGGSITAILFNTPGTPEAVATTFDGYPIAQQGKAGRALGLAISASAFGGVVSILIMLLLAPPLSQVALKIHSAEYFALTVLGMTVIASVGTNNMVKALISGLFGIFLATVGVDPIVGVERFTFGNVELLNGVELIPLMIGAFALAEVLHQVTTREKSGNMNMGSQVSLEILKLKEFFHHKWVLIKSALIGTIIGILPGTGGSISSIVSYGEAKRASKHPDKFGHGAEEGVIAPEAANNAAAGGSMIPTLVLGIPGSPTTAIILAALTLQGLQPGPQLMSQQPLLLYGIFISMLLGSILVFSSGRIAVQAFAAILKLPYYLLAPIIILLSIIGSYAVSNGMFQVWMMLLFGVVGFLMKKYAFSPAALVLGLVLGKMMEENLRRQLLISEGSLAPFYTSPISLLILLLAVVVMFYPWLAVRFKRENNTV
ncbi:tripartite tricarboxylate transporter permease [Desmospora activa]|uniref:Putative tricarboxylic transport membrane protein n=1 Tax=Desmospora activa DSM 45169 TaxID=1121389 RepID=A0A2T4ZAY3_9BACL|nr:tripartite tricarboxylate transporter permease [Desmospora activa]PTM59049.1 putative tricarboxylic transport membrane protein [Desmospora activa DSM 45169]